MSTNSIAAGMIFCECESFDERFEPRVRHGDDAEIRIDGAEGIICRLRFPRPGDRVKERGFADVWQADDSSAQHRRGR